MLIYNLCKQFGPRKGLTECWSWSVSKPFDTLIGFLKKLFFEKVSRRLQKNEKITQHAKSLKSLITPGLLSYLSPHNEIMVHVPKTNTTRKSSDKPAQYVQSHHSHFIQRSGMVCANMVEGIISNISVKLYLKLG